MRENILNDLKQLLLKEAAATQDNLRRELERQGYTVNQPKISRLLKKLNAVKYKNSQGEMVYCLPHDVAPPSIEASIYDLVLSVSNNEVMVVIKTSPGSAGLVARILDNKLEHTLGTIAGDDTIFITPTSIKNIEILTTTVKQLLAN